MVDEYELLEDGLSFAGFTLEFSAGLLLTRLTAFPELEKAASSILLLVLEGLFDPGEGLLKSSDFSLEDDDREGLESTFLLRLDV